MKARTKILIGTIVTAILIMGGILMNQNSKPTKQDYITFLKKHEQEMTDFVMSKNSKVTSVQWDWDSVEIENKEGPGGLPAGKPGKYLMIGGRFNEIENSGVGIQFDLDEDENIILKSMWSDTLRIGGKSYE